MRNPNGNRSPNSSRPGKKRHSTQAAKVRAKQTVFSLTTQTRYKMYLCQRTQLNLWPLNRGIRAQPSDKPVLIIRLMVGRLDCDSISTHQPSESCQKSISQKWGIYEQVFSFWRLQFGRHRRRGGRRKLMRTPF